MWQSYDSLWMNHNYTSCNFTYHWSVLLPPEKINNLLRNLRDAIAWSYCHPIKSGNSFPSDLMCDMIRCWEWSIVSFMFVAVMKTGDHCSWAALSVFYPYHFLLSLLSIRNKFKAVRKSNYGAIVVYRRDEWNNREDMSKKIVWCLGVSFLGFTFKFACGVYGGTTIDGDNGKYIESPCKREGWPFSVLCTSKNAKYLLENPLHFLQIALFLYSPRQNGSVLIFKCRRNGFINLLSTLTSIPSLLFIHSFKKYWAPLVRTGCMLEILPGVGCDICIKGECSLVEILPKNELCFQLNLWFWLGNDVEGLLRGGQVLTLTLWCLYQNFKGKFGGTSFIIIIIIFYFKTGSW